MNRQISVIIPIYNMADTVCRAIDSVLRQTYPYTQLIVIDDGSTDAVQSIIQSKYPDVMYIRIEHTGMAGVVRNRGVQSAGGSLIAFLDADDYWEPDVLAHLAACFDNDSGIGFSYGCLQYHGGELDGKRVQELRQPFSGYVFDKLVKQNFIPMHPALVKKELFEQLNGFDESLKTGMDYDLWLRVSLFCKVQYTALAKGYYCISSDSNFHRTDLFSRNLNLYRIMLKLKKEYRQTAPALWKRLAVVALTLSVHSFKKKSFLKVLCYACLTAWYSVGYWLRKGKKCVS